jgi:hypothetical protein
MPQILKRLSNYLGYSPPPLLDCMIANAQKTHQQCPVLQERFATAAQPTAGVSRRTTLFDNYHGFALRRLATGSLRRFTSAVRRRSISTKPTCVSTC